MKWDLSPEIKNCEMEEMEASLRQAQQARADAETNMRLAAEYGQNLLSQNSALHKQLDGLTRDHQALLDNQAVSNNKRAPAADAAFISNLEEINRDLSEKVESLQVELAKTIESGRSAVTEVEELNKLLDNSRTLASGLQSRIDELEV